MTQGMKAVSVTGFTMLIGCGGTNVTTGVSQLGQVTLANFDDGSAIIRVVANDEAVAAGLSSTSYSISTAKVPTTDIPIESPFDITVNDLERFTSTQYGEVYSGQIALNGKSYAVRMFTDNNSSTELTSAYDASADEKYTIVTGSKVTNLPTGDLDYTYQGQNLVAATNNTDFNADGGSFSLTVNFDDRSGTISASTNNQAVTSLSGPFTVNTETGYFSGDSLSLTAPNISGTSTAVITGSFHGDGATGVSGLYYDAGDNPLVNGAIIGSR